MKLLNSALVILDKPKHAQIALERGRAIQRTTGAHLHLASFVYLPMADEKEAFDVHQRRAMKKSCINERQAWLRGLVLDEKLSAADITTEVIWTKDIAGWVRDTTQEEYGLVIKTVHQSKTVTHTPLDWQLLRECQPPLLLASNKRHRSTGNVLATVDLRSRSRKHRALNKRVLDAAALFAQINDGKLHCVNAVEYSSILHDLDVIDLRKRKNEAKQRTEAYLGEIVANYDLPKSRVHIKTGKVGQVVTGIAHKHNTNLIVVGTSAQRNLGEVLIGGSAEKILGKATCDVLAVHP